MCNNSKLSQNKTKLCFLLLKIELKLDVSFKPMSDTKIGLPNIWKKRLI